MLNAVVAQVTKGLKDFAIVEPIQPTRISGHNAASMKATFTMQTSGGSFAVLSRMWVVERGNDLFVIGMSGPKEGEDKSEAVFSRILSDIEIRD